MGKHEDSHICLSELLRELLIMYIKCLAQSTHLTNNVYYYRPLAFTEH